nr:phenylalanine--tRNA ligase alpha subunit, cytoplasmic-like [Ipomoea batatas]
MCVVCCGRNHFSYPSSVRQLLAGTEASVSYSKEMAEDAVLGFLEKNEEILDSGKFSEEKGISHDEMVNAIKSLNGFGFVIAQKKLDPAIFKVGWPQAMKNKWVEKGKSNVSRKELDGKATSAKEWVAKCYAPTGSKKLPADLTTE